jgi:2-iminobutanoate/2-iminopropanoate deaminase
MKPIGPYSPFVKVGNMVYTSGQLPIDPHTGDIVDGEMEEQARQALQNMLDIIQESGSALQDVAKVNLYVTDLEKFPAVNAIYQNFFGNHLPARSCVQVAKLPRNAMIEVEAILVLRDDRRVNTD